MPHDLVEDSKIPGIETIPDLVFRSKGPAVAAGCEPSGDLVVECFVGRVSEPEGSRPSATIPIEMRGLGAARVHFSSVKFRQRVVAENGFARRDGVYGLPAGTISSTYKYDFQVRSVSRVTNAFI